MVQSRTGKMAGHVVAASAAIVGLLASGSRAALAVTEETCSNSKNNETVLSIFAREAFDRSNRVAVGPTRTTEILSGEILAGKTAVPPGLASAVITVLDDDGTEQVLEVDVAPVTDFVSSRILEQVRRLCSFAEALFFILVSRRCQLRPQRDRPRVRNDSAAPGRALGQPRSRGLPLVYRRQPGAL